MQDIIKNDVLNVLEQAIASLQAEDHHALGELSNHVIHDASIFQDDDSVSVAVLVYALSKMVQRCCDEKIPFDHLVPLVQTAKRLLVEDKYDEYRSRIRTIFDEIKKLDQKLRLYILEVLEKAKVKKASKLHEHGISLARTAELLGISQWELQDYIGKTHIPDTALGISARERLQRARTWFQ